MGDEPPAVPLSDRVKVIKTDMEETMRDALMATVAEVFDKAKEKTSANKDIIYKDIATGTKPGVKQAFDLKYPPVDNKATSGVYHCIVGTNFACSVTHETHFSCYLTCDNAGLAWSRAALPPGSATARQLGLLGRVRRVVRCLAHSGAEPWPTQSPQGSRDSHPCAPLRRIALRRIAWLSAARRTRHDPLECPGPHAWRLRCGLCGAAEAADLIAPLPLIPTTQVSLLIYKSKDSPFD